MLDWLAILVSGTWSLNNEYIIRPWCTPNKRFSHLLSIYIHKYVVYWCSDNGAFRVARVANLVL